jgi:hypothetical protein
MKVTRYNGNLPAHSSSDALVLSCVHPLYVPFLQGKRGGAGLSLAGGETQGYEPKTFNDFQSPLVVNLSRKGRLQLKAVTEGVLFDPTGSGIKVLTGWVAPDDALLAIDSDGDGRISSGAELFGEFSHAPHDPTRASWLRKFANGFQALQHHDLNHDGRINASDDVFPRIITWQDRNQNGISEPSEMQGLLAVGIKEISLAYKSTRTANGWVNIAGNELRFVAHAVMKDGAQILVGDVWFRHGEAMSTKQGVRK